MERWSLRTWPGAARLGNGSAHQQKGEVIRIEPNPEKLVEIGRVQVFSDKTWNPPALAGEYLLARNDQEAACLKLVTKKELAKNVALLFAKHVLDR